MRMLSIGAALMMVGMPATARGPGPVAATNGERDVEFADLADCHKALGGNAAKADATEPAGQRGSAFNRAAGNLSRCERLHGEYLIVVYPKGSRPAAAD